MALKDFLASALKQVAPNTALTKADLTTTSARASIPAFDWDGNGMQDKLAVIREMHTEGDLRQVFYSLPKAAENSMGADLLDLRTSILNGLKEDTARLKKAYGNLEYNVILRSSDTGKMFANIYVEVRKPYARPHAPLRRSP